MRYCEAVNHLKYGWDYSVIHDPAAYAAKYHKRLSAEDPKVPWREAVCLCDFGICDTSVIHAPHQEGGTVTFFVVDNFLGIPYRVIAPAPGSPGGDATYDPLPMKPLPVAPPATAETESLAVPED